VNDKLLNRSPQRLRAKEDQALQAGLFDAADKSLRVGIQVRGSRREFHRLHPSIGERVQEFHSKQRVAVMDQVPFPGQYALDRIGHVSSNLTHPQAVRR
jgi:hypothetical protein